MEQEYLKIATVNKNMKVLEKESILLAIVFYFFLQSMSNLVEAIYMIDLLNTQLDANVLGLLFFFSTIVLLFFKVNTTSLKISGVALVIFRLAYPLFVTTNRLLLSGAAVGSALIFIPVYMLSNRTYRLGSAVAFATLMSVLTRTLGHTLDITEYGYYQLFAWVLGGYVVYILITEITEVSPTHLKNSQNTTQPILGFFGVIGLLYMGYATPAVFARWSETNYTLIISLIVLTTGGYIVVSYIRPQLLKIPLKIIWGWNLLFFLTLILAITLNQVTFLTTTNHSPIVVGASSWYMKFPIYLNLLLLPILFIDLNTIQHSLSNLQKNRLVRSFLLAELLLVILVFMLIFTNVWGYVDPVSGIFRGLFWLPYTLIGIGMLSIIPFLKIRTNIQTEQHKILAVLAITLMVTTVLAALIMTPHPQVPPPTDELTIMTFNIQQGVNATGQKNYQKQLELIQQIQPDIIGLQESDTPKISTGASDVVRYFTDHLNYYSYYGPKTVMQTYGVALLSRFPITYTESFYTAGNQDEVGSIYAQVQVGSSTLNIFVNHPAGNDEVNLDHTQTLLKKAKGLSNVIIMGDFNWDESTQYYNMVTADYIDTWRTSYPQGVDNNGLNMSRTIDHIFVSPSFTVLQSVYIPSPTSQTDHPAYWSKIQM